MIFAFTFTRITQFHTTNVLEFECTYCNSNRNINFSSIIASASLRQNAPKFVHIRSARNICESRCRGVKRINLYVDISNQVSALEDYERPPLVEDNVDVKREARICYGALVHSGVTIGENSKIFSGVNLPVDTYIPKNTYVIEFPTTEMLLKILLLEQANHE